MIFPLPEPLRWAEWPLFLLRAYHCKSSLTSALENLIDFRNVRHWGAKQAPNAYSPELEVAVAFQLLAPLRFWQNHIARLQMGVLEICLQALPRSDLLFVMMGSTVRVR